MNDAAVKVKVDDPAVIENPLMKFRSDQKWSIETCALEIGVTPSTIIRIEQGLYNDIPPRVFRYLSDRTLSPGTISYGYRRWQNSRRVQTVNGENFRLFNQKLENFIRGAPEINPAILWRYDILGYDSRLAFCRGLCLHPSTVKRFEDGIAERMPSSIISVLGLSDFEIDWRFVDECYRNWRAAQRAQGNTAA